MGTGGILERSRGSLPDIGGAAWSAAALAILLLVLTGVSVHYTPAGEVLYSPSRTVSSLSGGGHLALYSVDIGNTGREAQENVRVCFSRVLAERGSAGPVAHNSGIIRRDIRTSTGGAGVVVDLGAIEPGHRVTLSFDLTYPAGQRPHEWNEVFLGMEPAKGRARRGNPGITLVGRAWFAVAGWFTSL